jgi:hypothetical protein
VEVVIVDTTEGDQRCLAVISKYPNAWILALLSHVNWYNKICIIVASQK